MSQQAYAPPIGTDIPVLGYKHGLQTTPSSTGHRLCPLAETGGPGWPWRREESRGAGARLGQAQELVPVKQEPRRKLAS